MLFSSENMNYKDTIFFFIGLALIITVLVVTLVIVPLPPSACWPLRLMGSLGLGLGAYGLSGSFEGSGTWPGFAFRVTGGGVFVFLAYRFGPELCP